MVALIVLGTVANIFLLTIARGYVLTVLWAWLIVPVFHLSELSIASAIGVSLVVQLMSAMPPLPKVDDDKIVQNLAYPWMALIFAFVIGWLVKLFI